MRVHLWAPQFDGFGGGIGEFSRNLAHCLRDAGHDVKLFGRLDRDRQLDGCRLKGAGAYPPVLGAPLFALKALHGCVTSRPDLIVSTHVNFGPIAAMARRISRTRYVLVAHGIDAGPDLGRLRRRALHQADAVWAVSAWTRERLAREGVPRTAIRVVPNTVRESSFDIAPRSTTLAARYGLSPREKVILTVARLDSRERYKGYDKVLRCLPGVKAKVGGVRYLVVGSGNDATRLKSLADGLGLSNELVLCGRVADSELADHYRLADVFAMPSVGEGFGIVYLEALACGIPVLAGDKDGSVDALNGGNLGLLVDPDSMDAIGDGLVRLLQRQGPPLWFNPHELRAACLARFGKVRFAHHVKAAVQFAMDRNDPRRATQ